jgi:multidrug resistance efflux pump
MQQATTPKKRSGQMSASLDARLWEHLSGDTPFDAFASAWLAVQCGMIPECKRAMLIVESTDVARVEIVWPEGETARDLYGPIADARNKRRGVVSAGELDSTVVASYPILIDGKDMGAIGLVLGSADREVLVAGMRYLQWGIAGLRERLQGNAIRRDLNMSGTSAIVLDVLATALEERNFGSSTRAAVTSLAERYGCERVSFGLMRKGHAVVTAISHTAHFGREMNLVAMVESTMEEAVDEGGTVVYPPTSDTKAPARAHRELADSFGSGSILTIPMLLDGRFMGALSLQRGRDIPFNANEVETLDLVATALAPVLEGKRLNDRGFFTRTWDTISDVSGRFFKRDYALTKFVTVILIALTLLFSFWFGDYEIVGNAVVEGREQRAVSAGFEGFLGQAPARAGDMVKKGALLAALDDRDLKLERIKWVTERQQHSIAYERALSERDRTGLRVADSLIKQADTQINLIDEQLSRANMVAPFDGIVVTGDHSQQIGAAVQRGDVLFEIAPANSHRIMVSVPESEIASLQPGQRGRLVLAALPGDIFPIVVKRLNPVAKVVNGRNVFEVEVWPVEESTDLRPGLQGAAKIDAGRARVFWLWTHTFQEWLQFSVWRFL